MPVRCVSNYVGCPTTLCHPNHSPLVQTASQDTGGPSPSHPYNSNMSTSHLVYSPSYEGGICPLITLWPTPCLLSQDAGQILHPNPHPPISEGMSPPWFQDSEVTCSEAVKEVLLNSTRDATQRTYLQKWTRFWSWGTTSHVMILLILDYILDLKKSGLSTSSIHVHLASITTFHPRQPHCLHPSIPEEILERSPKPLLSRDPTPVWDPGLI